MLDKLKDLYYKTRRLIKKPITTVALLCASTASAVAAPPDLTAAQTVFTDALTAAETLFGYALPIIGGIMILFIAVRLVKRMGSQV